MGVIFDFKRYAIHDGPGIRTTVFFKGCPLNCPWCHNPEGKLPTPEFMWTKDRCLGCGDCVASCPGGVISFVDGSIQLDDDLCNLCGICASVCMADALETVGEEMTVMQVMEEVERDSAFFEESGGGVTFSGGEPLAQPEFLASLLKECRRRGIHTAVDTSGYVDTERLLGFSERVDLFMYDLKVMDPERHRRYTGVSNALILKNLKELSKAGSNVVVRVPLIPGVNDDDGNIRELGELLLTLRNVKDVSLLPYHKAGVEKQRRLTRSKDSIFTSVPPPQERLEEIMAYLENFGLNVKIGG